MAESVLLKIARDSMLEVYQAKRLINKERLLQEYPILHSPINCSVTIYIDNTPKHSFQSKTEESLLENIIISAKKAAFEDPSHPPLSTSQYLTAEVELTLHTQDGDISEKDSPILKEEETLVI